MLRAQLIAQKPHRHRLHLILLSPTPSHMPQAAVMSGGQNCLLRFPSTNEYQWETQHQPLRRLKSSIMVLHCKHLSMFRSLKRNFLNSNRMIQTTTWQQNKTDWKEISHINSGCLWVVGLWVRHIFSFSFSEFSKCFLMSILKIIVFKSLSLSMCVHTFNTDLTVLFGKYLIFTFKFYLLFWVGNTFTWSVIQNVPEKVESETSISVLNIPGHLAPLPGEKD